MIRKHNTGLCDTCQEMETVEHELVIRFKYEWERIEIQRELQASGFI